MFLYLNLWCDKKIYIAHRQARNCSWMQNVESMSEAVHIAVLLVGFSSAKYRQIADVFVVVYYRHVINYLKSVLLCRSKTVVSSVGHNTSTVAAQQFLCRLLFWSDEDELISGETS